MYYDGSHTILYLTNESSIVRFCMMHGSKVIKKLGDLKGNIAIA